MEGAYRIPRPLGSRLVSIVVGESALSLAAGMVCSAAPAASPGIVVLPVLVSDLRDKKIGNLSASASSPKLSAVLKARVKIDTHKPLVELHPVQVHLAQDGGFAIKILDKAKAAWRFKRAVEPHNKALDRRYFSKKLVNLLLGRVKRQVSNV